LTSGTRSQPPRLGRPGLAGWARTSELRGVIEWYHQASMTSFWPAVVWLER
jgi:hypothetical protein